MYSLDEFEAIRSADRRIARLTHDLDFAGPASGIEIGALDNPTALPTNVRAEYVDYAPTDLLQAHPHETTVRRQNIVRVDHVWPGSGSLAAVCGRMDYDFAIASHVIEHVPNVLGWFRGIFDVLKDGGVFNLAIPDRRFTFDIRRKPSTLGEMVEAAVHNFTRPSVRQIFDHTFDATDVSPGQPWTPEFSPAKASRYSGDFALALAYEQSIKSVSENRYFDSHCWIFTPHSFLDRIEGATKLHMFPFVISDIWTTESGSFEFFVSFRKDTSRDAEQTRQWQLACLSHLKEKVEADLLCHRLLSEA